MEARDPLVVDADRRRDLAGPAVVAQTTEDDAHPEVRRAAQAHAKTHGCVLILYAADVASWLSEPMPNQWASEGEGDRFGDRLSPADLDGLGRSAIAGQVRKGRRAGARASAWLPKDKGVDALVDYASSQEVHLLFVSSTLDAIDQLHSELASGEAAPSGRRMTFELVVVPPPDDAMARA